jgi:uncharacterized protein (DUF1800 family)
MKPPSVIRVLVPSVSAFGFWLFLIQVSVGDFIDRNGNGMSDVWEAAHGESLDPDEDLDGDGFSNRDESLSGTDPFDAESRLEIGSVERPAGSLVRVEWPTVAGVRYRLVASSNLRHWYPVGEAVTGNGISQEAEFVLDAPGSVVGAMHSRWTSLTGWDGVETVRSLSNGVTAPQVSGILNQLELPPSAPNVEQFGDWVRGWVIAPETGDYTFWVAGDDQCELSLSTDADPANLRKIAEVEGWTNYREWVKYAGQRSEAVALEAGQVYYFEVLHREYEYGDHVSVAWTRPSMAEGTRETVGAPHLTVAGVTPGGIAGDGRQLFFKLLADHVDRDGDGVADFEEGVLDLDADDATTTPRVEDLAAAHEALDSASTVTLGVSGPRAYETGGDPGRFVVFRAGGIRPISVPLVVSGTAVSGGDFAALPAEVVIPAGVRAVEVEVHALADGNVEAQETVVVGLQAGSGYQLASPSEAVVLIDDAADVLSVAQLRGATGVSTGGWGTAAVRRAGNSLSGRVSLSFGGLNGAQTAAEVFVSSNGSGGPVVFTFPLGQVAAMDWDFAAAGGLSREAILAALGAGQLWVRVVTDAQAGAELLGQLVEAPGWFEMPAVMPALASPGLAGNVGEAARFLTQATFGPVESGLVALETQSFAAWIDAQQALPATYHLPYVQARRAELLAREGQDGWQGPRNEAWWQHALTAPDQLRQRMAFALSQILVVSQFGALDSYHEGTTRYYDMLLEHAFGNYRDLLGDVTRSPMMGTYLSMMRNRKPDPVVGHEPDENYAREIMQLFTIGLNQLHPDGSLKLDGEGMPLPTYTQDDTVALAHVFTGWGPHYDPLNPPRWENNQVAGINDWFQWGYDSARPMSFYPTFHDTLDRTVVGGVTIGAGTDGIRRLDDALDALFEHPNVGPFLAKRLIQRFVTSNPSPGYIHRVAAVFDDNGEGVRGDLGAVIKAVLLDYDARHPTPRESAAFGKPAEPLLRVARMFRVLEVPPPLLGVNGDTRYFLNFQWDLPEQAPLLASSVFNFFQPGYANPGPVARAGLVSPEFQIFAETTAIRQANFNFGALQWGRWTSEPLPGGAPNQNVTVTMNYAPLVAILNTPGATPSKAQELLIDYLDERFLFGEMSEGLKDDIRGLFASLPSWFTMDPPYQTARAQTACYLVLNSPEFFAQR